MGKYTLARHRSRIVFGTFIGVQKTFKTDYTAHILAASTTSRRAPLQSVKVCCWPTRDTALWLSCHPDGGYPRVRARIHSRDGRGCGRRRTAVPLPATAPIRCSRSRDYENYSSPLPKPSHQQKNESSESSKEND